MPPGSPMTFLRSSVTPPEAWSNSQTTTPTRSVSRVSATWRCEKPLMTQRHTATRRDLDRNPGRGRNRTGNRHPKPVNHQAIDAGNFAAGVATDLAVVQAIGEALVDTDKTFIGIGFRPT